MLGNFFMFLIASYLQLPLDILEPTPTTLDLQASTHNLLDPQTLDPRPTTPSTHNNKRIFLFIPLYGRSINQIFLLEVIYIWTLQVPKLLGSPHAPGTSSHPYGTHCRQLNYLYIIRPIVNITVRGGGGHYSISGRRRGWIIYPRPGGSLKMSNLYH